jgi:carbamoyl-phosphate synthase large subunit
MTGKICVLVTGVGGGGHGHEIVKALRLSERYHLIGVDMVESSFGLFDVDEAYTVPPASDSRYIEILLDICQQRKAKVLIHGSEPELKVISRNRDGLLKAGVLPLINSYEVIERCIDKWATMVFLKEQGFDFPHSVLVHTEREIPRNFSLPAVIKPAIGGGGSNNTFIVQDVDELEFACRYLVRQDKVVLVQEYVGTPEDEYTVGVLSTLDGELVGSIALALYSKRTVNRIQMPNRKRSDLSSILAIVWISQGSLTFKCVKYAKGSQSAHSKGPLNIQCRFVDESCIPLKLTHDFLYYFIRALMGFNEPDMLIRHHLLAEVPSPGDISLEGGAISRTLCE